MAIADSICTDIASYKKYCSAVLSPGKIIAISRYIAGISAADLVNHIGISRSLISAIENGTRGLPENWSEHLLTAFTERAANVMSWAKFVQRFLPVTDVDPANEWSLFFSCGPKLDELNRIFAAVEVFVRPGGLNLVQHIENLCFQYLTGILHPKLPNIIKVVFEPNTNIDNLPENLSKLAQLYSSLWPDGKIPVKVTTKSPLLAWVSGAATTEEFFSAYEKQKTTKEFLIADRKNGFVRKEPPVLSGLALFLFKKISCVVNSGNGSIVTLRPVDLIAETIEGEQMIPFFVIGNN